MENHAKGMPMFHRRPRMLCNRLQGVAAYIQSHYSTAPSPSFHPTGIRAAATSSTPLSVANKLNCAAAFLVSSTSTLIPRPLICFLVSGLSGAMRGPTPSINRSTKG